MMVRPAGARRKRLGPGPELSDSLERDPEDVGDLPLAEAEIRHVLERLS